MPRDRRPLVAAVDDEVVALGLAGNRFVDGSVEQAIGFRRAQRRAQIGRILLAEAHVERAGTGDTHAVTGLAEIVGHWRDESERAAGFGDADVARRPAGAIGDV